MLSRIKSKMTDEVDNLIKNEILQHDLDFSIYQEEYDVVEPVSDYIENWKCRTLYVENFFDSGYYLAKYRDVALSNLNPLYHFLKHGKEEKRHGFSPLVVSRLDYFSFLRKIFDEKFYCRTFDGCDAESFEHFWLHGRFESWRVPCKLLDFNEFRVFLDEVADGEDRSLSLYEYLKSERIAAQDFDLLLQWSRVNRNDATVLELFESLNEFVSTIELDSYDDYLLLLSSLSSGCLAEVGSINDLSDEEVTLFDLKYYESKTSLQFESLFAALLHHCKTSSIVPTPLIDVSYYRELYSDLNSLSDFELYKHYVMYGQFEGRSPNYFILHQSTESALLPFDWHKLSKDVTTALYKSLLDINPEYNSKSIFQALSVLLEYLPSSFFSTAPNSELLFYSLLTFREIGCSKKSLANDLKKWFEDGCQSDFSALFDTRFIKQELETTELNTCLVFIEWYEKRDSLSCSPLIDLSFYLKMNRDLEGYPKPIIEHYLLHGQKEDRVACRFFDPKWIYNTYKTNRLNGTTYYFLEESMGRQVKPAPSISPLNTDGNSLRLKDFARAIVTQNLFDLKNTSELTKQIEKISQIEPSIKPLNPKLPISVMPFNSDYYSAGAGVEKLLGQTDLIIFRDSINFGGADSVLANLYHALKYTFPSKKVSIVSVGKVDSDALKIHGLSREDIIDLSEFYSTKFHDSPLLAHILTELVYDIVVGSSAKAVFNLNCGVLWQAIELYGRQISSLTELYAYVFCDDRDEFGNVDGYPANYLGSTITYFTKVFCDSDSLKNILLNRLPFSKAVESKIITLKTPVAYNPSSLRDFSNDNKTICWAGRFDVQKRPDLLIEIADALPEFTFEVWGKKVIDSGIEYDFSRCANIRLMGLFEDIEEVLETEPTLFLYTADWDGVPTILLKMMATGIPIVASNVGGISEILPPNCIAETNEVSSFLKKIKQISDFCRTGNLHESYRSELGERSFNNYAEVLRGNLKSV